jgi:hypothetical protein
MDDCRYFVAYGHPSWSNYKEHVFDTEDEVLEFRKTHEWSEYPIRVIYGMEMVFEAVTVVETYRLSPREKPLPTEEQP